MGDSFDVSVSDLKPSSNEEVLCQCDYCNTIYKVKWYSYKKLKDKENNKDCCNNPICTGIKTKESMNLLYGVDNARKIDGVNQKIKATNINKYGCENPFGNDLIKEKIATTNMEKYGCKNPLQNSDILKKAQNTCLKKYGVNNYGAIYSSTHKGNLSPTWKGGISHHRIERATFEYRDWRKDVFSRDNYTCQCCGDKSSKGHPVELHSHHILNWKDYPEKRYDKNNGVTLCDKCHYLFHSIYGKSNNTKEQLSDFINKKGMLN